MESQIQSYISDQAEIDSIDYPYSTGTLDYPDINLSIAEYSALFEQRELRIHSHKKNRCPKDDGYLTKTMIGSGQIPSNDQLKKITRQLPNDGCSDRWDDSVEYSLNKKGRWALVDDFRSNIENWNEFESDQKSLVVSALEKGGLPTRHGRGNCSAYHAVEINDSESPIHRYTTYEYAQERTLIDKPKPPKKKKQAKVRKSVNDRRPIAPVVNDDPSEDLVDPLRMQYAIHTMPKYKGQHYNGRFLKERGHKPVCDIRSKSAYQEGKSRRRQIPTVQYEDDLDIHMDMDISDPEVEVTDMVNPSGNMSIDLADLAALQVANADMRSQKRLQRRIKSPKFTDFDFLPELEQDGSPGPSGITAIDQVADQSVQQIPNHIPMPMYFEMIPQYAQCTSESIDDSYLKQVFGEAYYECSCIPRRFVIDLTDQVKKSMYLVYGSQASNLKLEILCICKVMPPVFVDEEFKRLKVWINGSFSKNLQSLGIDTINYGIPKPIDHIMERVIKMITTLPLDSFDTSPIWISPKDTSGHGPVKLFTKTPEKCFDHRQSIYAIMETEGMFKKLQRQISDHNWPSCMEDETCGICYQWPLDDLGFSLPECKHCFCGHCWRSYCMERVFNGWCPLTCPYPGCKTVLDYSILTTFLPLPMCQMYAEQLRDQYVTKNQTWAWCPSPKCGRLVQIPNGSLIPVMACTCGYFWCTKCEGAAHWPATCEQAKMYVDKLKDRYDDQTLVTIVEKRIHFVEVKRCPHCRTLMEKGEGCIQMTCRCGKLFCWACGEAWNNESHRSCYNVKRIRKFLHVHLVDVGKGYGGQLREIFYDRSLTHRLAVRTASIMKFKNCLLSKCWNVPRRMQKSLTYLPACGFDPNLQNRLLLIRNHLNRFLEIHQQAHYLLQFIYVHMQYCDKRSWVNMTSTKWAINRLEFNLNHMEEACRMGNMKKVDVFMERVKAAVHELISVIFAVEKAEVV